MAVGPPPSVGELRGRMARATSLLGRAQLVNCGERGTQCAFVRPASRTSRVGAPGRLCSREDACQAFWARQLAGVGCALRWRGEPPRSVVGCLHAGLALWQCCKLMCGRAGWHGFLLLWPDDLLVAHWPGGMRGARGVNIRSAGLVLPDAGGMYLFVSCVRFHVRAALQLCVRLRLCLIHVFVSWCACPAVCGAYPSVEEGGFPREFVVSHA